MGHRSALIGAWNCGSDNPEAEGKLRHNKGACMLGQMGWGSGRAWSALIDEA